MGALSTYSPKIYYLYRITNSVNGKVYVGVTFRPNKRWKEHLSSKSPCVKLRRAMDKHGRDNFEFEILCQGTEEYILGLEPKAIAHYDSCKFGYNIQSGGSSGYCQEILNRVTDKPVFVSGFWFESDRQARKTLGIKEKTYKARKRAGTLGQTCITTSRRNPVKSSPVYVDGFWFTTKATAASILGISEYTALVRYRKARGIKGKDKC